MGLYLSGRFLGGLYAGMGLYTGGGAYTRVVLVRGDLGGLIRGGGLIHGGAYSRSSTVYAKSIHTS